MEAIPDVDVAVRTARGEGVVDIMEGDGVDRVNLLHAILFDPMTLERILLLLNFWAGVQVLYCHTAWCFKSKSTKTVTEVGTQFTHTSLSNIFPES